MKIALIIAAGGAGKRFGQNKQLFLYQGKPLIVHTIEKFQKQKIDQLIIVAGAVPQFAKMLKKYKIKYDTLVPGGPERCGSVRRGLAVVRQDITHVMIHDGARPNVTGSLLARLRKALRLHPAVIPVIPVTDTVKIVRKGRVAATPPRAELYAAQTPQCFRKEIICRAYAAVNPRGCTDDAMLAEKYGVPVVTIPGEIGNIKITTKADLRLF